MDHFVSACPEETGIGNELRSRRLSVWAATEASREQGGRDEKLSAALLVMIIIGTAGWSIGSKLASRFPAEGSALQRYASVFDGVEINSSFYRRHRRDTWRRWADSVPEGFRFAVKMPRIISHEQRLIGSEAALAEFIADIAPLGHKLGPILVQTPPSLAFDAHTTAHFLEQMRARYSGAVVLEPRHASWAGDEAVALLGAFGVTLVEADPSLPELLVAAQREDFVYLRLHGRPRIYYSSYEPEAIEGLAAKLGKPASRAGWCIFDNTASGAALVNALELRDAMRLRKSASACA